MRLRWAGCGIGLSFSSVVLSLQLLAFFSFHSSIYHLPHSDERMSDTASQPVFPTFVFLLLFVYQNLGELLGRVLE